MAASPRDSAVLCLILGPPRGCRELPFAEFAVNVGAQAPLGAWVPRQMGFFQEASRPEGEKTQEHRAPT